MRASAVYWVVFTPQDKQIELSMLLSKQGAIEN